MWKASDVVQVSPGNRCVRGGKVKQRTLKAWVGNYDGNRSGFIAAYTQEDAIKVALTHYADFKEYWHQCEKPWPVVDPIPLQIYTRPYMSNMPYVAGRCTIDKVRIYR